MEVKSTLNRIFIMGRLARDPELRHTQNGIPVVSFTLAVDRDFKDKTTGERHEGHFARRTMMVNARYGALRRIVVARMAHSTKTALVAGFSHVGRQAEGACRKSGAAGPRFYRTPPAIR